MQLDSIHVGAFGRGRRRERGSYTMIYTLQICHHRNHSLVVQKPTANMTKDVTVKEGM